MQVGQCTKGDKCKFSHDLSVQNKSAKKDIYTDSRDVKGEETEVNDEDVQVLSEESIKKFHICNHFLEAVEKDLYGWFWVIFKLFI